MHKACRIAYVLFFAALLFSGAAANGQRSPRDWALIRLDYARAEKAEQLRRFCDRIRELAREAAADPALVSFFDINLRYAEAQQGGAPPAELREKVTLLRREFNRYYAEKYAAFHNIIFIDPGDEVFYAVRYEAALETELVLDGPVRGALARCDAGDGRSDVFVDFHDYGPSSEPAAFYIVPVCKDNKQLGRIALQCAVNKVNSIFAWTEDLGQTGETFLVNSGGFMLTESNFLGDSTILTKKLDDRNIQAKFEEGRGHRTVNDYRGRTAVTSFEVFEHMGTRWLIVAKVDEDEIVTEHYARHARYYGDQLAEFLKDAPLPPPGKGRESGNGATVRVDMDEYLKAAEGESLETYGGSTCTALIACVPGKFGYMAHISPRDRAYGEESTNLLGQMIKRITTFDVYPSERRKLTFVIVAPHLESLTRITDILVARGFLLSQIRVLYNPEARSAGVLYDYGRHELNVCWHGTGQQEELTHHFEHAHNIGTVLQRIMEAELGS